jgi:hypothetical protein
VTSATGASGWDRFNERIDALRPPQRPDAQVVTRLAGQIAGRDDRVLLLGMTRELAGLGRELTVVDSSRVQIDRLWHGRPGGNALLADWRDMAPPAGHFTAAIGDGSLSALDWPDGCTRAIERIATALAPGGRLAIRCYLMPDEPETIDAIVDDVLAGREPSPHAMRWRVAMATAGREGNVAVAAIHDAFEAAFPDRDALLARTGWGPGALALVDAFRHSPLVYSFLTRRTLLGALGDAYRAPRLVASGDYPLAERCPFLVAERAA